MNSFVEIPQQIIDNIIKNSEYQKIKTIVPKNYNLILTGSVGVGKSTLSQLIFECFKQLEIENIQIYPEYIQYKYNNDNIGNTILDLRKQGIIDTETLQHFVLDIWNYQLEKNKFVQNNSINIFERLPDDAIYCFSKEAYEQGIISQESYFNLCMKYHNIVKKYNIPTFKDCELIVVDNNNLIATLNEILNIIEYDFENGIKNRIIGLKTDEKKYIQRIKQRGRISEIQTDINTFKHYNKFYDDMYKDYQFIHD